MTQYNTIHIGDQFGTMHLLRVLATALHTLHVLDNDTIQCNTEAKKHNTNTMQHNVYKYNATENQIQRNLFYDRRPVRQSNLLDADWNGLHAIQAMAWIPCNTIEHNTCNTIQLIACNTIEYISCNTMQYNPCNAIQYMGVDWNGLHLVPIIKNRIKVPRTFLLSF